MTEAPKDIGRSHPVSMFARHAAKEAFKAGRDRRTAGADIMEELQRVEDIAYDAVRMAYAAGLEDMLRYFQGVGIEAQSVGPSWYNMLMSAHRDKIHE